MKLFINLIVGACFLCGSASYANENISLSVTFDESLSLNAIGSVGKSIAEFHPLQEYTFTLQDSIQIKTGRQESIDDISLQFTADNFTDLDMSILLPLVKGKVKPFRPKSNNSNNNSKLVRSIQFIYSKDNQLIETVALGKLQVKKNKDKFTFQGVIKRSATTAPGRFKMSLPATLFQEFNDQAKACNSNICNFEE